MKQAIEFYFDFSSPYGYLGACLIDDLAARHGRGVDWHPILLGPVFQHSGNSPLVGQPLKGAYAMHDLPRMARYLNVSFTLPEPFPIATVAAARAFYWVKDRDPAMAVQLAKKLLNRFYVEGRDIGAADAVLEVARDCGIDVDALKTALGDAAIKARLKEEVDAAIAKGVCGSPFFIVDGEPFWGSDRLQQVEDWLKRGGW